MGSSSEDGLVFYGRLSRFQLFATKLLDAEVQTLYGRTSDVALEIGLSFVCNNISSFLN